VGLLKLTRCQVSSNGFAEKWAKSLTKSHLAKGGGEGP